ncbi:unnamed protein product [Prunus brigantina]
MVDLANWSFNLDLRISYLLYGPPGTGKLFAMPDQSILVIEDIDCTIMLQNRETENEERSTRKNQVTLSGLLNLIILMVFGHVVLTNA